MGRRPFASRARAGLTFIELLLAVAVSGLIMAASSHMLFSFAHFWRQSELEPRFAHHADGVVSFLEYCFDQSSGLSRSRVRRSGWGLPPGGAVPAFRFRLEAAHPFFVTETRPPPPVDAWIVFDEETGLSLLWHIPASLTEGEIKLHRTPLSIWVEDVEIGHFDAQRNIWEYESYNDKKKGSKRSRQPQSLRILFNKNGLQQTRYVRMHRHDRHVLIY